LTEEVDPKGHEQEGPKGHEQEGPKGHEQEGPEGREQALPEGHEKGGPEGHEQAHPKAHPKQILIDGDACPVKEEIYKAAYRHNIPVRLVAGSYLRHPNHPLITMEMAGDGFDAADDLIFEAATPASLVVTADILLAERCLEKGAAVLNHKGAAFTANSIGTQVATRAIMADIRAGLDGQGIGGQRPFSNKDRSSFSNALETALRRLT